MQLGNGEVYRSSAAVPKTGGIRPPLSNIAGSSFDVAVVGGGVNGATVAQHLAADGYSVLLVEKGDFGAGSSSRSSRLLHCGLFSLAPETSLWEFIANPLLFIKGCRDARLAMKLRTEFVETAPERVRPFTFCFPLYEDGPFAPWQVNIAFRLLAAIGGGGVPLDYHRLNRKEALAVPFFAQLRDHNRLSGVATLREYQFNWPERVVMDALLDAERLGAVVRNYTSLDQFSRDGNDWKLTLSDNRDDGSAPATVRVRSIYNMAGIWIDQVNQRTSAPVSRRYIKGTKGVHLLVRLDPAFRDYGIFTFTSGNQHYYCVPWKDGLHYFGPTHIPYEGDIENLSATEEEIGIVLAEAAHLLPGLGLSRKDIIYTWAGVRPLSHAPGHPLGGTWSRVLHDLSGEGMPNCFALTGGTLGTHRETGRDASRALRLKLKPSGAARPLSYAAKLAPLDLASPPLSNHKDALRVSDFRHVVENEYPETLSDVLYRRMGAGWGETAGREVAQIAAEILGSNRGWSPERVEQEVADYLREIQRLHGVKVDR